MNQAGRIYKLGVKIPGSWQSMESNILTSV